MMIICHLLLELKKVSLWFGIDIGIGIGISFGFVEVGVVEVMKIDSD